MSCCGSHRQAVRSASSASGTGAPSTLRQPTLRPLVYTGPTSLSVLGPATGKHYRFAAPGAKLAIDPRDWAALARLPMLEPDA